MIQQPMKLRIRLVAIMFLLTQTFVGISQSINKKGIIKKGSESTVHKSEIEWKQQLLPDQYYVLRQKGTERPFTGKLFHQGVGTHTTNVWKCYRTTLE